MTKTDKSGYCLFPEGMVWTSTLTDDVSSECQEQLSDIENVTSNSFRYVISGNKAGKSTNKKKLELDPVEHFASSVDRTWISDLSREQALSNAALGLAGESGEVVDEIKKHLFHGKRVNKSKLYLEMGDVLYYMQAILSEMNDGITIEDLKAMVINKLKKRHPNGFDPSYHTKRKG